MLLTLLWLSDTFFKVCHQLDLIPGLNVSPYSLIASIVLWLSFYYHFFFFFLNRNVETAVQIDLL